MATTNLVGWHTVDSVSYRAREIICNGDEARTTPYFRYYVERAASGWWLYTWAQMAGGSEVIRCRELDPGAPQGTTDSLWITSWQR